MAVLRCNGPEPLQYM